MNSIVSFILFAIVCFVVVFVAIAFFQKDAIFTIAIGTVIGANIYNIGSYPINIGSFVFGIDGVIYSIFLFCLLSMYVCYGRKDMKLVLYTALFSIFFTALLAFFGSLIKTGITNNMVWSTLSYLFSIVATYVAVIAMTYIYEVLKKKNCNIYLNFLLTMIAANLINSCIYFGLTFVVQGSFTNDFVYSLAGSSMTKMISTCVCLIFYYFNEKYFLPKYNKKHQIYFDKNNDNKK